MTDVYAIIDALREHKYLSVRKLAELAGINPSTLATIMARRPKTISRKYLEALGGVLGVMWFDLVNVPEYAYSDDAKIPAALSAEDAEIVLHALIGSEERTFAHQFLPEKAHTSRLPEKQMEVELNGRLSALQHDDWEAEEGSVQDAYYRQSIIYMLGRLNTEGLLEAMHQVAAIARNPSLCRGNIKEDTLCEKEKPPMATEHSRNERMDAGKDNSRLDSIPGQEN